jgi:hypothetical protein
MDYHFLTGTVIFQQERVAHELQETGNENRELYRGNSHNEE